MATVWRLHLATLLLSINPNLDSTERICWEHIGEDDWRCVGVKGGEGGGGIFSVDLVIHQVKGFWGRVIMRARTPDVLVNKKNRQFFYSNKKRKNVYPFPTPLLRQYENESEI